MGMSGVVGVAEDAEVEPRLTALAEAQAGAGSDSGAGDVGEGANTVEIRDGVGAGGGVVLPEFTPAEGLECRKVKGQRLLDVVDRDVDVIDHDAGALHAAAFLRAKSRNVRPGLPVISSTTPLGRDPLPDATVSVSGRSTAAYTAGTPVSAKPV